MHGPVMEFLKLAARVFCILFGMMLLVLTIVEIRHGKSKGE